MKLLLLCFSLFITSLITAQTVVFADNDLKDDILFAQPGLDVNNDGEIQYSEAEMATYLTINNEYDFTSVGGIEAFVNITDLWIRAHITQLDLSPFQVLTKLHLYTDIPTVDVSVLPNLEDFSTHVGATTNVIIGNMPSLKRVEFLQSSLVSLDLTGAENLEDIFIDSWAINNLQLGYKPNLTYFYIYSANLTNLDLSQCPVLNVAEITVGNATHDVYVNLKNGYTNFEENFMDFSYLTNGNPSYHCYVCIDEGETLMFSDENVPFGVYLSPYCTFEPGGSHNTVSGSFKLNNLSDCDTATEILGYGVVSINGDNQASTAFNDSGGYNFYVEEGTYTLAPQVSQSLFIIDPPTATVTFANSDNNVVTQNFCLTANGTHPDVDIVIVPLVPARPGFDATYKMVYTNKGNQALNGDVIFTYDDTVLEYVSASPVESASAIGSLTWNYDNLQPFESREINFTLNVNSPMEVPAVNIDDVLNLTATISPVENDETLWDNIFGLKQVVVGSFDPNDITCLEGTAISPNYIGQYLHYNINFENTGTYPATFVVVKDVIDEAQFDVSTVQLIDASHDVEARVTGNKVEFYFNDINLPANGGKGNVVFKIKSLGTLQANDDITQQAEIFFDYNLPIVTNEATTVFSVLSNPGFDKDTTIKVYPNPTGNTVTISAQSELKHVALYDLQGRLLQAVTANGTQATLDLSGREGGVYVVKTITEKGAGVEKVMKL